MSDKTVMPIAVGFYLLALPLVVAIFLADETPGRVTNAVGALVMIACGVAAHRRSVNGETAQ